MRRASEGAPGEHELPGDDPLSDDVLFVVDVLDERVQRPYALDEAVLDHAPLVRGQDTWHEIEREWPVARRAVGARGVEGDALLDEDRVAPLARGAEPHAPEPPERLGERGGRGRGRPPGSNSSSKNPGAGL